MRDIQPFLVAILFSAAIVSCGTLKNVGRTINDAASIVCEIFATENGQALAAGAGMDPSEFSPEQWCSIHENIQPFIDEVLAAQQTAGGAALGK